MIKQKARKYVKINSLNEYLKDTNNTESSFGIAKNIKRIKILDIRKNEHFGDVLMFLNKKSPLYVRVSSNKADLLLLKKLDALRISTNYPNIWKKIIKKPLANSKIIQNLTLKILVGFCNYYGIKTHLFKKRKRNKNYPPYYLRPILNNEDNNTNSNSLNKEQKIITEENNNIIKGENILDKKKETKIKIIHKYKSCSIINNNNNLINKFKGRYKDLDVNDSIKASKTLKNNNYINSLDLNSEQNKSNHNFSQTDYLS